MLLWGFNELLKLCPLTLVGDLSPTIILLLAPLSLNPRSTAAKGREWNDAVSREYVHVACDWNMKLYCTFSRQVFVAVYWFCFMWFSWVMCRIYQQMETLGLFLFNDTLVVTTRTNSHVPFERCVEHIYTFDTCAVLLRLHLEDIPDSKCL